MSTIDLDNIPAEVQKEGLEKMRQAIKGKGDVDFEKRSDRELLRFLKARQLNVENASDMYINHLKWRAENKIDEIQFDLEKGNLPMPTRGYKKVRDQNPNPPDEAHKRYYRFYGGFCFHKYDKLGHPIYIERSGMINASMIAKYVSQEVLLVSHYQAQKLLHDHIMKDCSEVFGKEIETSVVIFDCKGIGMHQMVWPAIKMLKHMSEIDQQQYPERLQSLYCVNVPGVFKVFYDIGKKWVDQRVLSKVHVYTPEQTKEGLLKAIEAESLPEFLGGTCKCSHMEGGCVPSFQTEGDGHQYEHHCSVKAREKFMSKIEIKEAPATLRWSFETKKYDIKFGLFLENAGHLKEVVPVTNYASHEVTVSDAYEVKEAGVYVALWDNSHSMLRSKDLSYSFSQLSQEE